MGILKLDMDVIALLRLQMPDRPFLLFIKKGRSISSTQHPSDRPFGYECFCRKGSQKVRSLVWDGEGDRWQSLPINYS
ncbi:MAG: hypothetical protein JGK29_09200 [Microcoleus sp. PH2017_17_BER_D_A]|nr:hypothetical protein [Microcoleus sp. PH2017_17_BER_D_A]